MAKRLFLYTICCLIQGLLLNNFLTAADKVTPVAISNSGVVETVIKEEPESVVYASYNDQTAKRVTRGNKAQNSVSATSSNSIAVAGRILDVVKVSNTDAESGDHTNMFGDRYIYGHNLPLVFRGLHGLGKGSVFTVAIDGVSRNYQVVEKVYFEKLSKYLLKDKDTGKKYNMDALTSGKNHKYDMVLTTCAGEVLENGDSSERLVLFAVQI